MFRSPALSSTEKASPPRRPPYIPALLPDSLRSALRMDICLMPHAKKPESLRIKPSAPRDSRHATFWVNPKVVYEPRGSTTLRGMWNYFFCRIAEGYCTIECVTAPHSFLPLPPLPPRAHGVSRPAPAAARGGRGQWRRRHGRAEWTAGGPAAEAAELPLFLAAFSPQR